MKIKEICCNISNSSMTFRLAQIHWYPYYENYEGRVIKKYRLIFNKQPTYKGNLIS